MLELSEPRDDGLVKLAVGEWSKDKHHFLHRYIDAFTTAMKSKNWSALHYVDLFAGPGMLQLESTNELMWGSPLIAAQCPLFDAIHVCELNSIYSSALEARIQRVKPQPEVFAYNEDANVAVHKIVKKIPARSLSIAFLDPFGLHLNFDTLKILAQRRMDLIIFFPDHMDALRNCNYVYRDQPDSNLDRVLGSGVNWRHEWENTSFDRRAEALKSMYVRQIADLGYSEFEFERILNRNAPLYLLIYCSHHAAGSKIWRGISQTKPSGQRTWDFGA